MVKGEIHQVWDNILQFKVWNGIQQFCDEMIQKAKLSNQGTQNTIGNVQFWFSIIHLTLVKEARWLFLGHFWPLLRQQQKFAQAYKQTTKSS